MLCNRRFFSYLPGLITANTGSQVKATILHHVLPKRINSLEPVLRGTRTGPQRSSSLTKNTLEPALEFNASNGPIPSRNIVKSFFFTGAFGIGCFMGATVLEYENTRNMMLERARQTKFFWSNQRQFSQDVFTNWKTQLKQAWNDLNTGQKVFVPICALNVLAFGLWRIPALRQFMLTYFCSNPAARVICWPMCLSTFSHYSPLHLFANMYVLHSFCIPAVLGLGKEQFLAVYLTSGVFASFFSYTHKFITSQAGLSLGASGAIMAILAFVCANYPDTQLSVLFLPMFTFSAGAAIKVIMSIDIAGCILGWKFFDHAAHLGGAVFGLFWAYFGKDVWQQRIPFLTLYHDWRKTK